MKKTIAVSFIIVMALALFIFFIFKLLSNVQYDIDKKLPYFMNSSSSVYRVIDGDTFETTDGKVFRLLCVDTPEENEEGYDQATEYLSSLIYGENLRIEEQGLDSYNRTLAWIYVNDLLVNREIVNNGYGTLFEYNGTDCGRMK